MIEIKNVRNLKSDENGTEEETIKVVESNDDDAQILYCPFLVTHIESVVDTNSRKSSTKTTSHSVYYGNCLLKGCPYYDRTFEHKELSSTDTYCNKVKMEMNDGKRYSPC